MKKAKVLKPIFVKKETKTYEKGEYIELDDKTYEELLKEKCIEKVKNKPLENNSKK